MSIDSHQSETSHDESFHAGVHSTAGKSPDSNAPEPATAVASGSTSGIAAAGSSVSRPPLPAPASSSESSTGNTTPITSASITDDENEDDDDFSKASLSLEFDDYPLDLVSPITKVGDDNDPAATELDRDLDSKSTWRPTNLLRGGDFASGINNNNKRTTSTPKYNGDRLSFMEYNEILFDAGTEDQSGFVAKRTSTPKYPHGKRDRLSGYVYDALNEYPRRGLFSDGPLVRDKKCADRSSVGQGPCQCLKLFCAYLWRPFMRRHNPLPEKTTRCVRLHHALLCPPQGVLADVLTVLLGALFIWGVLWGLTRRDALPGGNIFALLVVFAGCSLAGAGARKLGLPSILGKNFF